MFNSIHFAIASPDSRKAHFLKEFLGSDDRNNIHSIFTYSQQFFCGLYT